MKMKVTTDQGTFIIKTGSTITARVYFENRGFKVKSVENATDADIMHYREVNRDASVDSF